MSDNNIKHHNFKPILNFPYLGLRYHLPGLQSPVLAISYLSAQRTVRYLAGWDFIIMDPGQGLGGG